MILLEFNKLKFDDGVRPKNNTEKYYTIFFLDT